MYSCPVAHNILIVQGTGMTSRKVSESKLFVRERLHRNRWILFLPLEQHRRLNETVLQLPMLPVYAPQAPEEASRFVHSQNSYHVCLRWLPQVLLAKLFHHNVTKLLLGDARCGL